MQVAWNRLVVAWASVLVIELVACAGFYLPWIEVFQSNPVAFETPMWVARIAGFVALSFFFTYIYAMTYRGAPWFGQGIRFGLSVGLFVFAGYFIGYSFGKMTNAQLGIHAVGNIVKFTIAALAVAYFYRPAASVSAPQGK